MRKMTYDTQLRNLWLWRCQVDTRPPERAGIATSPVRRRRPPRSRVLALLAPGPLLHGPACTDCPVLRRGHFVHKRGTMGRWPKAIERERRVNSGLKQ